MAKLQLLYYSRYIALSERGQTAVAVLLAVYGIESTVRIVA